MRAGKSRTVVSGRWSVVRKNSCFYRPLTASVDCRRCQIADGHVGGRVCGRAAVLAVVGFDGVHGLVGGDEELAQTLAVCAEARRTDADADARGVVGGHAQRETTDRALDAFAQVAHLIIT